MEVPEHLVCVASNILADEAITAGIKMSPHYLYRPRLSIDGNQWCALYGEDLQDGVAGFGDSPAKAMADFDKNWQQDLPERKTNA